MAEHTEGPWVVTTNLDYWVEPANAPTDGGFHGIAHCGDIRWPGYQEKQFEWEANARLIAAAPDLLAALQSLIRFCDEANDYELIHPEKYQPYIDAKAIIAKTTATPKGRDERTG